jgi:hypothetical protein
MKGLQALRGLAPLDGGIAFHYIILYQQLKSPT